MHARLDYLGIIKNHECALWQILWQIIENIVTYLPLAINKKL
jgi:hypothetical protein